MKTRLVVMLAIFAFVRIGVQAQETYAYRLREPTAKEYLAAVPTIMKIGNETYRSEYSHFNFPLFDAMTAEIYSKYPQFRNEDVDLLYGAYLSFRENNDYWYDRDSWVHAILLAWINQYGIDLSETHQLNFLGFEITIISRDYNNDGYDEWLLRVQSPDFTQDIILAGSVENYTVVDSPLPWFGCCFMYWDEHSGFSQELIFSDINNDSIPEWVIALGGVGGGQEDHGWLYILQWQDNKLIDLAPQYESYADHDKELDYSSPAGGGGSPLFPFGVDVRIENVDDDPSLEILINQQHTDNWGCNGQETRVFKWDEHVHLYQLEHQEWQYEDSAGCSLRQAQAAMWQHDYVAAISFFERSLEQFSEQDFADISSYEAESNRRFAAYASVRLALAYSLTGHPEYATRILNSIQPPSDDMFMGNLITRAQEAYQEQNSFDLCLAMYDVTSTEYHRYFDSYNAWLGLIVNDPVSGIGAGYPSADPELAGCEINQLIDEILQSQPFNISSSPIEILNASGATIDKSFHADLNSDGIDDWLIWFSAKWIPPMFFLSGQTNYHISRPFVDYPDDYTQLTAWELPDDTGTALLRLYFDGQTPLTERWYYMVGGGGPQGRCADEENNFMNIPDDGRFEIWQLRDKELVQTQLDAICQSITFADLFPYGEGSGELHVWYGIQTDDYSDYPLTLTSLLWDSEEKRFIAPSESSSDTSITNTPQILIPLNW